MLTTQSSDDDVDEMSHKMHSRQTTVQRERLALVLTQKCDKSGISFDDGGTKDE